MTAQVLSPVANAATGDAALAVLYDGSTTRFEAGYCGVLQLGGALQILDADRRIAAEYPTGRWTILPVTRLRGSLPRTP